MRLAGSMEPASWPCGGSNQLLRLLPRTSPRPVMPPTPCLLRRISYHTAQQLAQYSMAIASDPKSDGGLVPVSTQLLAEQGGCSESREEDNDRLGALLGQLAIHAPDLAA